MVKTFLVFCPDLHRDKPGGDGLVVLGLKMLRFSSGSSRLRLDRSPEPFTYSGIPTGLAPVENRTGDKQRPKSQPRPHPACRGGAKDSSPDRPRIIFSYRPDVIPTLIHRLHPFPIGEIIEIAQRDTLRGLASIASKHEVDMVRQYARA